MTRQFLQKIWFPKEDFICSNCGAKVDKEFSKVLAKPLSNGNNMMRQCPQCSFREEGIADSMPRAGGGSPSIFNPVYKKRGI